ncbi:hypothetical protein ABIE45_001632 [Methylobacterium sp. OAE515]|uniref:BLUF domain-containing protein n=1 Tax=Methylobacterium sp. OAE515 TaxID=2817895 RepID=UPI0017896F25
MNPRDRSDLFRLVYRSRSAIAGSPAEVQRIVGAIVAASQHRNAGAGVTGALLFASLHFVQALEGPASAVEATFDRICRDLRHTGIEVVECGPVLEPAFGNGPMSHLVPDADAGALLDRLDSEAECVEAAAAAMKLMLTLLQTTAAGKDREPIPFMRAS